MVWKLNKFYKHLLLILFTNTHSPACQTISPKPKYDHKWREEQQQKITVKKLETAGVWYFSLKNDLNDLKQRKHSWFLQRCALSKLTVLSVLLYVILNTVALCRCSFTPASSDATNPPDLWKHLDFLIFFHHGHTGLTPTYHWTLLSVILDKMSLSL